MVLSCLRMEWGSPGLTRPHFWNHLFAACCLLWGHLFPWKLVKRRAGYRRPRGATAASIGSWPPSQRLKGSEGLAEAPRGSVDRLFPPRNSGRLAHYFSPTLQPLKQSEPLGAQGSRAPPHPASSDSASHGLWRTQSGGKEWRGTRVQSLSWKAEAGHGQIVGASGLVGGSWKGGIATRTGLVTPQPLSPFLYVTWQPKPRCLLATVVPALERGVFRFPLGGSFPESLLSFGLRSWSPSAVVTSKVGAQPLLL